MRWEAVCERLSLKPEVIYPAIVNDLKELSFGSDFCLEGLPGGASNRGYLRLRFNSGKSPGSMILMVLKELDPRQGIEEVVEDGFEVRELPFLSAQRHFGKYGVAVPAIHHYNSQAGLIYLEDLGDVLLRDMLNSCEESGRVLWLEKAVDELIRLQLVAGRAEDPDFIGFRMRFNSRLIRWELEHFREWALDKRLGPVLKPEESALLTECFEKIKSELLASPYILSHRDYHIDNLMVSNDRIRVIDFQDAFMAPYAYDLASLLYDRDTSLLLGKGLIEHIINYYFQRLRENGFKPLDFDGFRRVFDLCVLHRAFKIVGRFYFLAIVKNKPEYLDFQPAEYIVLGEYLDRFAEFKPVKDMLKNYLPELTPKQEG